MGATDEQIAEALEVTKQTLHNWRKKHAEFFDMVKKAKALPDNLVEQALFKRATGAKVNEQKVVFQDGEPKVHDLEKEYPPDTAAAFIWLKNRRPEKWRDKHEVEHSGNVVINFDPVVKE